MIARLQNDLEENHSDSLYQDGIWVSKAIDKSMPHITVCNQVGTPFLPKEVCEWLSQVDPAKEGVSLGVLDVFKQNFTNCRDRPDAKYDVIVWQPAILPGSAYHQLHRKLHAHWNTQPQQTFNPHITIGYVKSGKGEEIVKGWQSRPDLMANSGFQMKRVIVKEYKGEETSCELVGYALDHARFDA
jgi:2'-5' RNA ligase